MCVQADFFIILSSSFFLLQTTSRCGICALPQLLTITPIIVPLWAFSAHPETGIDLRPSTKQRQTPPAGLKFLPFCRTLPVSRFVAMMAAAPFLVRQFGNLTHIRLCAHAVWPQGMYRLCFLCRSCQNDVDLLICFGLDIGLSRWDFKTIIQHGWNGGVTLSKMLRLAFSYDEFYSIAVKASSKRLQVH